MKLLVGVIQWYDNLRRSCKVTADLQGEKITRLPMRGSPQGGVLSPLIWNMIMHALMPSFQEGPGKAEGYADDILLMASGKDPNTLAQIMQRAINKVLRLGDANGLTFNQDKISSVIFTKRRHTKSVTWKKIPWKVYP